MLEKIKGWFFEENDEDISVEEHSFSRKRNKDDLSDIVFFVINETNDMSEVADAMKQGKTVVVKIKEHVLIRTLDFVSGVQYALGYKEQKLTRHDYVFVPPGMTMDKTKYNVSESNAQI